MPILLSEKAQSPNSMISGFSNPWNPWNPVFIHFTIPKYFTKYNKLMGTSLNEISYLRIQTSDKFWRSMYLYVFSANFGYLIFVSILVKMGTRKLWEMVKWNLQNHGYELNIYQKTWNGNLVTFVFSGKGIPSTPCSPVFLNSRNICQKLLGITSRGFLDIQRNFQMVQDDSWMDPGSTNNMSNQCSKDHTKCSQK